MTRLERIREHVGRLSKKLGDDQDLKKLVIHIGAMDDAILLLRDEVTRLNHRIEDLTIGGDECTS